VARTLFDPSKAAGAETPPPASGTDTRPLTVSQASDLIRHALDRHTPAPLRIIGQVSNLSTRDHWYFSLKDAHAVLPCVAWATTVRKLSFRPADGEEVIVAGHLSYYAPQGKTQLYVDAISPVGAGALEAKFRALCEELRGLGYFEEARKRPLPVFPRRIAVITSSGGAAVQDVIHTAAQRCKAVGLLIVDVRVQGDGAAEDVARAIKWVNAKATRLAVQAILVTRGGGSIEDLWAFNQRIVADAIFHSHLPVVAAIGHESDTTIAELVADVRASTPTQAAMRLVPAADELCRQLEHIAQRIEALLRTAIARRRQSAGRAASDLRRIIAAHLVAQRVRLGRLDSRLLRLRPEAVLAQRAARLHIVTSHLHAAMARRIARRELVHEAHHRLHASATRRLRHLRERVHAAQRQLSAVDPHGVLRRGYSITTTAGGGVVRSVRDVRQGALIATRVADGTFGSIVSDGGAAARRSRITARAAEADDQFDLFH
jgi:exodeoxyribonuclease VII large subunit